MRSHGTLLAVESKEIGIYSQGSGKIRSLKQGRVVTWFILSLLVWLLVELWAYRGGEKEAAKPVRNLQETLAALCNSPASLILFVPSSFWGLLLLSLPLKWVCSVGPWVCLLLPHAPPHPWSPSSPSLHVATCWHLPNWLSPRDQKEGTPPGWSSLPATGKRKHNPNWLRQNKREMYWWM